MSGELLVPSETDNDISEPEQEQHLKQARSFKVASDGNDAALYR